MRFFFTLVLLAAWPLLAQQQQPQQPGAPGVLSLGELRDPSIKKEAEKKEAEAPDTGPVVLKYEGKPIKIPFQCTEEDIQAFGMTCTIADPCPVYVELAGLESLGTKVFLTGNFHNGSTTMYSLLLMSEDGGKTWVEAHERIKNAGLDHIQFFDMAHGWVSGQLLMAIPRDPFFLATRDGGKTWRRYRVFSESAPGMIDDFWFESPERGSLVIDRLQTDDHGSRHYRYETMTGAENWMIRELSATPIKLRESAVRKTNPNWRIRADGERGTHILERKQGDRFQTVAAFFLEAGACRPDAAPLVEPPPPEPPEQPTQAVPAGSPRGRPSLKKP
jgi:hypothetical protein